MNSFLCFKNANQCDMNNLRYFLGLLLGMLWFWFFYGWFYPDQPISIRISIMVYVMLYIDEGLRRRNNRAQLKKENQYAKDRAISPAIILFKQRINIRWIYHVFASLAFLMVLAYEYKLSFVDSRFLIALFMLAGANIVYECYLLLSDRIRWRKDVSVK